MGQLTVLLLVTLLARAVTPIRERHYYLAAIEVDWNYAPTGMNLVDNDMSVFKTKLVPGKAQIGSVYRKAIYRQFTDDSFTKQVEQPPWHGINGPIIAGEVGETVFVHFKNMASRNFSVHVHGFRYDKQSEGARYNDGIPREIDDAVPPGWTYVYEWDMRKDFVPTDADDNCVAWPYHGGISDVGIRAGIVGVTITCKPGTLYPDGARRDVDKQVVMYADSMEESLSPYFHINSQRCGLPKMCQYLKAIMDKKFIKSHTISHINGFAFGNMPDVRVCAGERVVTYMMSLFADGVLTMHVNGQVMLNRRQRKDTLAIAPGMVESGYMTPVHPGRWLIQSKVQPDYQGGMRGFMTVSTCSKYNMPIPSMVKGTGARRRYYLAIEETMWNYRPMNMKYVKYGHQRQMGSMSPKRPDRIGTIYKKAVFRHFADRQFKVRVGPDGLAGPPIKAEVGDTIEVVILNRASRTYSFLPNGLEMSKENEGAVYKNNPKSKKMIGVMVAPGSVQVYRFYVGSNSGPTKFDAQCLTSTYHSAVNYVRDVNSGLFGPLVICRPGTLGPDGRQIQYNKEFYVNWMVFDENLSWYIKDNIRLATDWVPPAQMKKGRSPSRDLHALMRNKMFRMSNKIHAINGLSHGTLDDFRVCLGEQVTWHMYSFGDKHVHIPTFDGNNVFDNWKRVDTISIHPGMGKTVTMVPDFVGRLKLYTSNQMSKQMGMFAFYNVMACDSKSHLSSLPIPGKPLPFAHALVRRYYIGAIPIEWDYCPTVTDMATMKRLDNPKSMGFDFVRNDGPFIGHRYTKAVFQEFTDGSFTSKMVRGPEEIHLGLLGPVVRATVGDTIEIVLNNDLPFPVSFSPRNIVPLTKSVIQTVSPGTTFVYNFLVPERSGPRPKEPGCVGFSYLSRANTRKDIHSGLFGPLIICKPGILDPVTRMRIDGVRERTLAFVTMDESQNHFYNKNKKRAPFPFPAELEGDHHGGGGGGGHSTQGGHGQQMSHAAGGDHRVNGHGNYGHGMEGLASGMGGHGPGMGGHSPVMGGHGPGIGDHGSGMGGHGPGMGGHGPGMGGHGQDMDDHGSGRIGHSGMASRKHGTMGQPGHGTMNIPEHEIDKYKHSNMYHVVNGYIYSNIRGLITNQDEAVTWYMFTQGGHHGIHTIHFHGNLLTDLTKVSSRDDVFDVYPGIHKTVVSVFRNPGTWLLHCHVVKHAMHGMKARYTVLPHPKNNLPVDLNT